jgi:hypothetical protein
MLAYALALQVSFAHCPSAWVLKTRIAFHPSLFLSNFFMKPHSRPSTTKGLSSCFASILVLIKLLYETPFGAIHHQRLELIVEGPVVNFEVIPCMDCILIKLSPLGIMHGLSDFIRDLVDLESVREMEYGNQNSIPLVVSFSKSLGHLWSHAFVGTGGSQYIHHVWPIGRNHVKFWAIFFQDWWESRFPSWKGAHVGGGLSCGGGY